MRPYAHAVAGEPLRMRFDRRRRTFEFAFRHDPAIALPTEIFVPDLAHPRGCETTVSDGSTQRGAAPQTLVWRHDPAHEQHELRIRPRR